MQSAIKAENIFLEQFQVVIALCRSFFLRALLISYFRICTLSRKCRESDTSIMRADQRGRHPSVRRNSDEER